VTTIALQIYFF